MKLGLNTGYGGAGPPPGGNFRTLLVSGSPARLRTLAELVLG